MKKKEKGVVGCYAFTRRLAYHAMHVQRKHGKTNNTLLILYTTSTRLQSKETLGQQQHAIKYSNTFGFSLFFHSKSRSFLAMFMFNNTKFHFIIIDVLYQNLLYFFLFSSAYVSSKLYPNSHVACRTLE